MIERTLASRLTRLAEQYPVVTVTGPRQAGKTTLCRSAFPDLPYVNLEALDVRGAAIEDPRGFLLEYQNGVVIDEVQHAPDLLSYIQVEVDERPDPGRFVLTGSQHLGLTAGVAQSLAGRTAILELFPPSWGELQGFDSVPTDLIEVLWTGAYPRVYDRQLDPRQWLADYVATYVERDVRQLLQVGSLEAFTKFARLCAGRTAAELNLSALGADAGISHNTARAWLSVLEASYLVFRLPAWHPNVRKQIVRAPKLHFVDTGLACHLLGMTQPDQLRHHPLRGAVFETWVVSEIYKQIAHSGMSTTSRRLFHYRDSKRLEVDLVIDRIDAITLVEAKSGATIADDFVRNVQRLADAIRDRGEDRSIQTRVFYGGETMQTRHGTEIVPWREIGRPSIGEATGV